MKRIAFIAAYFGFLCVAVIAQDKPALTVTGFRGLVTSKGDFDIQPNEFRRYHDVDNSLYGVGKAGPRQGVVSVAKIAGIDSILGIFTANYRNRDKQMFVVTDSDGVGYGNIYGTVRNTDVFDLNFGTSTDSTFLVLHPSGFDTLNVSIIIIDSFFVKDDTIAIRDTAADATALLTSNDTLVARINAHATLSDYVTAGIGAAPNADTTYYFKEDYADTSVVFRQTVLGRHPTLGIYVPVKAQVYQTYVLYPGGFSPANRIATEWGIQRRTSHAQFNDLSYFVNGQQKGIVYNGDYVSVWPLAAPGEIEVVPIDSTDNINGERMYALVYTTDSSGTQVYTRSYPGYLTPRTLILDGGALLKHFPVPALATSTDTFNMKIYATKTTAGRITESDYLYLHSTHTGLSTVNDVIYDLKVVDTLPDSALSTTDSLKIIDLNFTGRRGDTTGGAPEARYGAPLFISSDTIETDSASVYQGVSSLTVGHAYMVSFIDTANAISSDGSRTPQQGCQTYLMIFRDSVNTKLEGKYTISLPKAHNSNNVVKNIWRAQILVGNWDSLDVVGTWALDSSEQYINIIDPATGEVVGQRRIIDPATDNPEIRERRIERALKRPGKHLRWELTAQGDTIIDAGNFRLLAQVPDSQTFFIDRISQDSLNHVPHKFQFNQPPTGLEYIFVHNGQLFGWKGSRLYWSRTGSLTDWELFDFASFNLDDGDVITFSAPFRGGFLVGKNYTAFNLLPDLRQIEISGIPGCLAPASYIEAQGAHYYVSNHGVVALTEGEALIRHHNSEILSKPLNNFLKMSYDQLSSAVGAYVPQREQLWWCIGDTSYVYDFESDSWATSSLTFAGSTLYDVDTTKDFQLSRSLYFFKSGDSVIYKFGDGHKNSTGAYVQMWIETGPLFQDAHRQQILRYGLWAKPDTTYVEAAIAFYNQGDTLVSVNANNVFEFSRPRLDRRLTFKEIYTKPSYYFRMLIVSYPVVYPMLESAIDRIDFWVEPFTEEPIWE